jgi:hypothetical protein
MSAGRPIGLAALAVLAPVLGGCGQGASVAERVARERLRFEVELISWAPLPDGQVALDLQVAVAGRSDLKRLTVEVRQVDASQQILRADPVSLDVAGMDFDARRRVTVQVPSAGDAVAAVAVVLEAEPGESARGSYPEFQPPSPG